MPVLMITAGSFYLHDTGSLQRIIADPALLAAWMTTLAFIVIQLVLAWSQKPVQVNPREQAELDRLRVTVVIPCYNEDPQILDRTIVSLVRQTRLPDHIEVVDDGSTVDYSAVRDYWLGQQMPVRFTWVRQRNAGKKHAQAVTFTTDPDADIFVTIDSDSALDRRAINEGLKPFADQRVASVAGLETAINIDRNLLTRAIGHRSLVFQLFAMSAQSVARGSVLINPGAFSLYRAPLIRKIVPSYLGETFFGVPVTLGDDTALTLYALLHGRAVHQPTAVSLPVYPETVAHHLRQWTRWMRASTIRMLWRLRYLPVLSYGWIFTVYTIGSFLFSIAVTIAIPLVWPASEKLVLASIAAMVIWPLSISLRLATVRRSDQGVFSRLFGIALLPLAALWYVLVLRQIRFYGIATCWRQGWVTRQHVEVRLDGGHEPGAGHLRVARDPRLRGAQVARDPRAMRERDGARYPWAVAEHGNGQYPQVVAEHGNGQYPQVVAERGEGQYPQVARGRGNAQDRRLASGVRDGQNVRRSPDPRHAGNPLAAREQSVRQQARWRDPYADGAPNGWQPPLAALDQGNGANHGMYHGAGQMAAHNLAAPPEFLHDSGFRGFAPPQDPRSRNQRPAVESGEGLSRGNGFDPRGYQNQRDALNAPDRWAAQDQMSRGRREQLDRRARGPQPPLDPRRSMPQPDQRPTDSRHGWAVLEQRTQRDAHDHDGGYTKEYRP